MGGEGPTSARALEERAAQGSLAPRDGGPQRCSEIPRARSRRARGATRSLARDADQQAGFDSLASRGSDPPRSWRPLDAPICCPAAPLCGDSLPAAAFAARTLRSATRLPGGLVPDLTQPIDADATERIRRYTTAPDFNSPLTDYLPASKSVPAPQAVLGDVAGAPGYLPYSADVHRYFRLLAEASPRVRVVTIGTSEEGRERIAVAVSSEENLVRSEENRARLAQLADPRKIDLDDSRAESLIAASVPVYYITGAIHSPETGSPTALMELAYRLAVDESPYIRKIRDNLITLITPVVEVDGRDRMVDLYRWHRARPGAAWPRLAYWGRYVAHDNNRDAMGMTLSLTRNVLDTHLGWHAQVLHDLHESVPFLYDNTVGAGPYNAWVDPLLTHDWQLFGWSNVAEMTKLGMPGVFTHGEFDTWSPGYLMFLAAMHNSVSRLYETFGNGGADTEVRELSPEQYSRTWYRQDPPWPRVEWSQRNNNNYQQTGLLVALAFAAENRTQLLSNFYARGKRAIAKPLREGPSAWVLPADDRRPEAQAELLRVLGRQHVEISRISRPFTVRLAARRRIRARRQRPRRRRSGAPPDRSACCRPAATSCAWTSPTAGSPTRSSTGSTGAPTIRRSSPTTTPGGASASSSTSRRCGSSTARFSPPR